ncbi:MAG: hypothetical protein ACREQ5_40380, partial [Candidatus Dormibacteria bacterium]
MAQNLRMPEPEPRPDGPTIDPIPDPSLPEPPPGTWPITTPIEDPPVRPIDTVAVQRLRQDLPPQKRQGPPTSDVLTDPQKRGATGRDKPDVRQS